MASYSHIKGFNYQPSYGSSGLELWQKFDAETVRVELGRGKKHFPKMNAIRLWLSRDSFWRDQERFLRNFDEALSIADSYGLVVMPVLMNRWHSVELDYGGVYIDHFFPRVDWDSVPNTFLPYVEAVVGPHADDERIFMWDLCNEPMSDTSPSPDMVDTEKAEFAWLEAVWRTCKRVGARAPICVGTYRGLPSVQRVEPISDVLTIHPYIAQIDDENRTNYEHVLDEYVTFSEQVGKPLLATECCWGDLDDQRRVEKIRCTLTQLKKREIGWLVYLLHHSLIADAHRPEFGPLGGPANLAFIEADGSLRPGHEIFNEF